MSDWKIGDKCYYFWHANECSLVWDLKDFKLEEDEIIGFNTYGRPLFMGRYHFRETDSIFKTKSDAVNAMMDRLNQILEEK